MYIAIDTNIVSKNLQSDTCGLYIPELDCETGSSGLGGRFTTVEGILIALKDQLVESSAVFHDSEDVDRRENIEKYEN